MLSRSIVCAIVMGWSGIAAAQTPPPRTPATGTAVIRGRIVAADTGKPLRRARIGVASLDAGGPPRTANTNVDGRYEVNDLPAGRYTIAASRSGYLQLRYGQRRPLEAARPLQVADGQTVERIDFALPRTGLIAGRVTDEVGDPIAGVLVFALRPEYWQGRRQLVPGGPAAQTDDTGRYRIVGLAPGDYVVRAMTRETWSETRSGVKSTMLFAATYFPGTANPKDAQGVTVGLGQQVNGYDFRMVPHRAVTVSGIALDSHGRPAQNVLLGQDVAGPNGGIIGSAGAVVKGADGAFTIRDVPPGEYTLKAAGADEIGTLPLVVGDADIDNVSLVTSPGWSLTGSVTTETGQAPRIPRGRFRLAMIAPTQASMQLQGQPVYRQTIEDDGTFTISGIAGAARLRATLPEGWMLKTVLYDGRDVADLRLEGKGGETLSRVQVIVTDRITTIAGQLTGSRGVAITDATILVFDGDAEKWADESRFVRAVRPDFQGKYEIKGLPAGDYLAVALDYVLDGLWNDPQYLASIRRYGEKLTLRDGESRTISLKLTTP